MNVLAIETSCGFASASILTDGKLLAFAFNKTMNMQAENLFDLIDECFKDSRLDYSNVNYLAVTTGPGSFTGIRIGLSAAKGILFAASHVKPVPISNFEVMAFRIKPQISQEVQSIVVLFEASSNSVYAQVFDLQLNSLQEPIILSLDQIPIYLANLPGLIAVGGSGLNLLIKESLDLKQNIIYLPRFVQINARSLIMAANYFIANKRFTKDMKPLYIKPPSVRLSQ